jgi:hypothetical protein
MPLAYDHGLGFWVAVTLPIALEMLVAPILAAYAQSAGRKRFLVQDPAHNSERAWADLITLPLGLFSWTPLMFAGIAAPLSLSEPVYFGISLTLSIILTITGAIGLGYSFQDNDPGAGVRWGLFVGAPLAMGLFHLIFLIVDLAGTERRAHKLLPMIFGLPLFLTLLFFVNYFVGYELFGELLGLTDLTQPIPFILPCLFAYLILLGAEWIGLSTALRDAAVPEDPGNHPALRPQLLRLFDDATLYKLADKQHYPSGRRPLIKIWWEGGGSLYLRSDRTQLVFSLQSDGTNPQTVPGVIAPMKWSEYGDFLTRNVRDSGGVTGKLKWSYADSRDHDYDYELPPGAAFADGGDEDSTSVSDHDDKAKKFVSVPSSADSAMTLYHAPKTALSVRFGQRGAVVLDQPRTDDWSAPAAQTAVGGATHVTGVGTSFTTDFRAGDVIQIDGQARVVVSIEGDRALTVGSAFAGSPSGAFKRLAVDRIATAIGAGSVRNPQMGGFLGIGTFTRTLFLLEGSGTEFLKFFKPGDTIRITSSPPQIRRVTAVLADDQLVIDQAPTPTLGGWTGYERPGARQLEGYPFAPNAPEADPGESLVEKAADLAALLLLGGTSQVMTAGELNPGGGVPALAPIYQCFRNWNLSRRRVNEWRMLVLGSATSEKRGAPHRRDPAMSPNAPDPAAAPADLPIRKSGEKATTSAGWVPVLRKWVAMQGRFNEQSTAATSFMPGDPTNQELTRAMGFLLDLAAP